MQVAGRCLGAAGRAYVTQSLTLQGGFTLTDWVEPVYGPTVLDAQGLGEVVYLTGTAPITYVLENLHITGGSGSYGAGVYLGRILLTWR